MTGFPTRLHSDGGGGIRIPPPPTGMLLPRHGDADEVFRVDQVIVIDATDIYLHQLNLAIEAA